MQTNMKRLVIIICSVIIVLVSVVFWFWNKITVVTPIRVSNFIECVAAGYPVIETSPRSCRAHNKIVFTEADPDLVSKPDLIVIETPRRNQSIKSPLSIAGKARGNWFFEASFPIRLIDGNGNIISRGIATAQGEWMTVEFVPFTAHLEFGTPGTKTGTLVLDKDNPSGLPEHADELRVPIIFAEPDFATSTATTTANLPECKPTGCSGQICSDQDMITTCEYRAQYACYKDAICERQTTGQCGWTQTTKLKSCLANPPLL